MSNKMSKDIVPEDFTLSLVLVDAVPVLFFGLSMVIISLLFHSPLFLFGALLSLFAGTAKVIWKLIVVLQKKNIWWLFVQMRYLMPIGFLCMIIGGILGRKNVDAATFAAFLTMPAILFFSLGLLGMGLMLFFAFRLDSSDLKSNWIEQITNGCAQICIFIGLLFVLLH